MLELMKLELRRNNIRTYVVASMIIAIVMLGFIYLFAYAPRIDPNDKDLKLFEGYNNLISLFGVLNMSAYCVLSSIMSSKFIIEEYSGKRPILLFSYPISRRKMILAKLCVVCLFTIFAVISSNLIIFSIFAITELFLPLLNEALSATILIKAIKTTMMMAFSAASMGLIAAGIGFMQKSVPATIISAVLLSSLLCNVVANASSSDIVSLILTLILILVAMTVSIILIRQVNLMEVE